MDLTNASHQACPALSLNEFRFSLKSRPRGYGERDGSSCIARAHLQIVNSFGEQPRLGTIFGYAPGGRGKLKKSHRIRDEYTRWGRCGYLCKFTFLRRWLNKVDKSNQTQHSLNSSLCLPEYRNEYYERFIRFYSQHSLEIEMLRTY